MTFFLVYGEILVFEANNTNSLALKEKGRSNRNYSLKY